MTKTTAKRLTLCLTRETDRQLNELCDRLGESRSQAIVRCINYFYMYEYPSRDVLDVPQSEITV